MESSYSSGTEPYIEITLHGWEGHILKDAIGKVLTALDEGAFEIEDWSELESLKSVYRELDRRL